MNRRDALRTFAATGLAASLPTGIAASASAAAGVPPVTLHTPVLGPRMNFEEADRVMAMLGLDALVLGTGTNFQHATGHRSVVSRMGHPPSSLVIVTKHEDRRLTIVTSAFGYYFTLSDMLQHSGIPAYLFTQPTAQLDNGTPVAGPLTVFPDRGEVPTDEIEDNRVTATNAAIAKNGAYPTQQVALASALKDLGLNKARLAVDHVYVDSQVAKAAPLADITGAEDALRRIRTVKSASEIVLMRQASAGNVAAALEAVQSVRTGGSYRQLRNEFYVAAAKRGQRGVFMVVDRTSDELYDDEFKDGQAFMIDCVSEYEGYHGDYGRTVFIGEPNDSMKSATKALATGWDSVREQLRPGLKFSEIYMLGQKALRTAGKTYNTPFAPHSVGLYHSDHMGQTGLPQREDIVLRPGMILSIDCPLIETGVGGSAHLEDLMLITSDGAEPIHEIGHQTITV
ncbi:MAG: M24 family metallopeptidase [Congregibacter sp.]